MGLVGLMLLGVAAVVIDLGHAYVVRREIQQAAESGAYSGARALALPKGSTTLNWDNAKTTARATVQENAVDGVKLSDFDADGSLHKVQAGYWDIRWTRNTAPDDLNGSSNPAGYVPTTFDVAAVKVKISKTDGGSGSGGPMKTFMASVWGFQSMNIEASAVAILPVPTSVPPGDCFPMATPQAYVTQFYDQEPPVSFRIGATETEPGNWTSFLIDANNVPTVRQLIDGGNPDKLNVGDQIWIEPGVKATLYDYAQSQIGKTFLMCVVPNGTDQHSYQPILGFVAFYIEAAQGGTGKYIQGHFVKNYIIDDASGLGGAYYGTTLAPKLIN